MKKILFFVIFAIIISNCSVNAKSKKGKIPSWLKNPKKVYPDQLFLTAIGEGDTRTEAENMATANLSKIFESVVHAEENVNQRYTELTKNKKTESTEQTEVQKNVKITSSQNLFNIQFAESYTDKMGRVHVLAYINRMQTAEIYIEKIEKNAEKVLYFIKKSKTDNPIKKYAYLSAAMVIAQKNDILIQQLQIINNSSLDMIKLGYNKNELGTMLSDAANNIGFNISVKGDSERITNIIEAVLTDLGFVANKNGVLKIEGNVNFEETSLNRKDGFKFVRYTLLINIKDQNNNIIVALNEKGREGHTTYKEAKERCIRKLEKKLKRNLKRKLLKYFDSLAK